MLCALSLIVGGRAKAQFTTSFTADRMKQMSLEELVSLQITTMSRKEESWWSAPGAIDVITSEELRRSTVQNLPDALRLATGVDVAQSSARSWGVSIRGFDVLSANKISVVMDGRSLYAPFFSGVQWDAQETLLEDIDRIEVVRGPVGALWGAFAANGLIQIVTKSAEDTQGTILSAGRGTEDPGFVAMRYGGKLGLHTFYRVYAKYFETDWTYSPARVRAAPPTDFFQSGFRIDSLMPQETAVTLQGDVYTNKGLPISRLQTAISGWNILGRWHRSFSTDSDLQIDSYYDHTDRLIPGTWKERRDTESFSAKFRLPFRRNDLLLGADLLISADEIGNFGTAPMDLSSRTTHNAGIYFQDTITLLPDQATVSLGLKGEHNSFSGLEYEPSVRAAWTPSVRTTVWAAVSRGVRAPVRIDQNLVLSADGHEIMRASDDFQSEKVIAYELGWRHEPWKTVTFDLAAFLNRYHNLRTTEPVGAAPFPLIFKNSLRADSIGAELTVRYQPFDKLFFKAGYRYLDLDFIEAPGSRDTTHATTEGNDPRHILNLSSHARLPWNLEFDTFLRYVSSRPAPATASFIVMDIRLGWAPNKNWDVSLSGRNLFDAQHRELITTSSANEEVRPSATLKITWRY